MSKKIIWIIVLIIIVIALIIIFSVRKPAEKGVIKIGAILPLTGPIASYGTQAQNGILLALDEVKQGVDIELIFEDEKCDAQEAVTAYHKLRNVSGVNIIIGAGCSQSSLAIAPLAEKDQVILFTSMSAADTLSDAGDFIFRNHTFARQYMDKLSNFVKNKWEKIISLYDVTNDNAVLSNKWFKEQIEKEGSSVFSISISGSQPEYQTEALKLKQIDAEVIHLEIYGPKDVAQIIKNLTELGINKPLLLDHAAATAPEFKSALGNLFNELEAYFVVPDFDENTSPEFWTKYKGKFGEEPTIFSAQSYDILKILSFILKDKCSNEDTICIKDNLYQIQSWRGASGVINIDQNGDAAKPLIIKTIKNGQFVPYEE